MNVLFRLFSLQNIYMKTIRFSISLFPAIITSLDHETPVQPLTDSKPLPYDQNYRSSTRMKRSTVNNGDSAAHLYDNVVTKLKDYFFNSPITSRQRSSYDDVQDRISNIMSQLGEPKLFVMLTLQILFFQVIMNMGINSIRQFLTILIHRIFQV